MHIVMPVKPRKNDLGPAEQMYLKHLIRIEMTPHMGKARIHNGYYQVVMYERESYPLVIAAASPELCSIFSRCWSKLDAIQRKLVKHWRVHNEDWDD